MTMMVMMKHSDKTQRRAELMFGRDLIPSVAHPNNSASDRAAIGAPKTAEDERVELPPSEREPCVHLPVLCARYRVYGSALLFR